MVKMRLLFAHGMVSLIFLITRVMLLDINLKTMSVHFVRVRI